MAASEARPTDTMNAPGQTERDAAHSAQSGSLLQLNIDKNDSSSLLKLNSIRKQSSLLHQNSYLKQTTSGFMRWQSRRAFWSAVDASDAQTKGTRVACVNTRLAIAYWFKMVSTVARRHPSVIVAPLLLGAALMAGGLCGVVISAQNAKAESKDDARAAARLAAGAVELLVYERGLQPTATLASLARQQPNVAALREALPRLEARLLAPELTAASVRQLMVAPFGVVAAVLKPSSAGASNSGGSSGGPISEGTDLQSSQLTKDGVAQAIQKQAPVVASVVQQSAQGGSPEVLLYTTHPVFVPGVAANETWGNTGASGATDVANCGNACYNASSRTKLWGFTSGVLSLSNLVGGAEGLLSDLQDQGYRYRLQIRAGSAGNSGWTALAESSPAPSGAAEPVTVPVRLYGTTAAAVSEGDAEGELSVYPSAGWQPTWEGPLIAVVVLVSLALMVLLFEVLLNYWRHMLLLKAMLPEKVISVLGRGAHYYQHFECVTVLYADVVRYTTGKPQHGDGAPTLEVVKLLNDVHSMYETIIEKHGLVRIRRSGESFMCVGGCPTPDDPVAVAVRVASCARDLVLATSRFRGSGGFRVQIRVGLHTGPVVAAVVGSKMPRFSLFGDVVDVAYYMEATSRAMAVHVSDLTSQLLATADDPFLQLRPRGRLEIIGQGTMFTNWLKVEALPEPIAAPGEEEVSKDKKVAVVVEEALKPGK